MRHLLALAITTASLLAGTALFAQGTPQTYATVGESAVDRTTQSDEVGLKSDKVDRMTVPVTLGGEGPYHFLVDTGSERSAISRQLASKLKLAAGPDVRVHSISGVDPVATAIIRHLRLSENYVDEIEAPVFEAANLGADGMLGVDSLRSQRVEFDFKKETMLIVPSVKRTEKADRDTIIVRARLRNGRLIMTNAIANDRAVTVIIDTGSQITMGNPELRRKLTGNRYITSIEPITIRSVTGAAIQAEYTIVRKLKIGDIMLTNLAVAFADAHIFKQLKLDDRPALLLGMNAIRAFDKVSIDFANKKVRVVLPKSSAIGGERLAARQ